MFCECGVVECFEFLWGFGCSGFSKGWVVVGRKGCLSIWFLCVFVCFWVFLVFFLRYFGFFWVFLGVFLGYFWGIFGMFGSVAD